MVSSYPPLLPATDRVEAVCCMAVVVVGGCWIVVCCLDLSILWGITKINALARVVGE